MTPDAYESWYTTPKGQWIADTEYALLRSLLRLSPDSSLLDIGCGTGHFTRRFACETKGQVVGIDPNAEAISWAAAHAVNQERYVIGRAEALPFPDRSFDCTVAVTSLCFIDDQQQALREMIRVTRRRFVLGLLNRHSLLHFRKGRAGGTGGYRGAHWHTAAESHALLASMPVRNLVTRTAIVLPGGGALARTVERIWPSSLPLGGFLAVAGDVRPSEPVP